MLGAEGRARGDGSADTDICFSIRRDSLEPDLGVSAMGRAGPHCPVGGVQSCLAPHSHAWKPRLELKGLEVTQLRNQVPVPHQLQTPMDDVGGTNTLLSLQFAPQDR